MNTKTPAASQSEMAVFSGLSDSEINVIKSTVAKGTSNMELAFFLKVAQSYDLSPFKKEIWCYKDHKNNLITFAGRDGFLTIAQRNKDFKSLNSAAVRENDNFEMNIPDGIVKHTYSGKKATRGAIIGSYAIVDKHSGGRTIEWAEFDTYNKGSFVWKSHPEAMIKKVAELNALKKTFGITLQSEFEYTVTDGVAAPIETEPRPVDANVKVQRELKALFKTYTGEDKNDIQQMLFDKQNAGELTPELILFTLNTMKLKMALEAYTGEDKPDIVAMLDAKEKANELTPELIQNTLKTLTDAN